MFNLPCMKTSLLRQQIDVFLAYCIRQGNREGTYNYWLNEFTKVYSGDAYDIPQEAIDEFLFKVSTLYNGQHALNQAERAIRAFMRYYSARSRNLATKPGLLYNYGVDEKKDRNRELVLLRLSDPEKWSWRKLGAKYEVHFTTAKEIFHTYVSKYGGLRT